MDKKIGQKSSCIFFGLLTTKYKAIRPKKYYKKK
jgi:hypothetical protein